MRFKPRIKFGPDLIAQLQMIRLGGNAVPDILDETHPLGGTQLQGLGQKGFR